jgi:hypothetical protein
VESRLFSMGSYIALPRTVRVRMVAAL